MNKTRETPKEENPGCLESLLSLLLVIFVEAAIIALGVFAGLQLYNIFGR